MKPIKIKIICPDPSMLPTYQTEGSAGMDLHAHLLTPVFLKPMERKLIPTGIFIELPIGLEAQIRSRSGLALKNAIVVLNSPATIDSDYRGEYGVMLINLGDKDFEINGGDRIAQLVITKYEKVDWRQVTEISTETSRAANGFGSTGK